MSRRLSIVVITVGLALVGSVWPTGARAAEAKSGAETSQASEAFQQALQKGKDAYNAQEYQAARGHFVEAIQVRPDQPTLYRNLARTNYWMKDYPAAVHYYDIFLRLAPDSKQTKQITAERRSAADRAGDKVWKLPADQQRVLEALRDQLNEGAAYTEGGGGAWALYRALLRSGYAQPELARLQKRLRQKLLDEFEGLVVPESGQPTPQLTLTDWKRQRERLQAARRLALDPAVRQVIDRRELIVEAAVALLNNQWQTAADRAAAANEQNPDMTFVRWFQLAALLHAERYREASRVLESMRSELAGAPPQLMDYLTVMEGVVAQRRGNAEEAATNYSEMLD